MTEQEAMEAAAKFIGEKGTKIYRGRNLVSSVLGGLVMVCMALFLIGIFGSTVDMTCERTGSEPIECSLVGSWLGLFRHERDQVYGLQGASLEESYDNENDSYTYRIALNTLEGRVYVTKAYSSGYDNKSQMVREINEFVADPSQLQLDTSSGTPWFALITGAVLILTAPLQMLWMLRRRGKPFGTQQVPSWIQRSGESSKEPSVGRELLSGEKRKKDFWD